MWKRACAVLAVVAMLTVPLFGAAAGAQTGPEYLPGDWLGEMWFREEVRGERDGIRFGVQQVGSGGLDIFASTNDAGSVDLEGLLTFAVLVRAYSSLGVRSTRVYEAEWGLRGSETEISTGGEVTARGVDSALLDQTGEFVGAEIEFSTQATGLFTLKSASCAGWSGSFETRLISPPGGDLGVAFSAMFMAVPGENEGVARQLELVKIAAQGLFNLVYLGPSDESEGFPSGDPSWGGAAPEQIREVLKAVNALNQAIADAGVCGEVTGDYAPGGVAQQWLAELLLGILDAVSREPDRDYYTAAELVELYYLGASMGALATSSPEATEVQERYPEALEGHLEAAREAGKTETIELIETAACQFGWDDLKEDCGP